MKKNLFLALTVITMLLASCTIQQRVYQPGLSIEWKTLRQGQAKSDIEQNTALQTTTTDAQLAVSNEVIASTENVTSSVGTEPAIAAVVEKEQKVSKKELKQTVKEFKQEIAAVVSNESAVASVQTATANNEHGSRPQSWVYIALILLVPFGTTIAVYLSEGYWSKKVTINLLLTLLCVIPGLIHALVTIFGKR